MLPSDIFVPRLVLLANHVLSAEPVAMQKLQPHAGCCIELKVSVPERFAQSQATLGRWLPQLQAMRLSLTPAGLLEWTPQASVSLTVSLGAPSLTEAWQMLKHRQRPPMQIEGDAQLAEAISWVAQNVRWDVAADLQHWFGMPLAASLGTVRDHLKSTAERWQTGRSQNQR